MKGKNYFKDKKVNLKSKIDYYLDFPKGDGVEEYDQFENETSQFYKNKFRESEDFRNWKINSNYYSKNFYDQHSQRIKSNNHITNYNSIFDSYYKKKNSNTETVPSFKKFNSTSNYNYSNFNSKFTTESGKNNIKYSNNQKFVEKSYSQFERPNIKQSSSTNYSENYTSSKKFASNESNYNIRNQFRNYNNYLSENYQNNSNHLKSSTRKQQKKKFMYKNIQTSNVEHLDLNKVKFNLIQDMQNKMVRRNTINQVLKLLIKDNLLELEEKHDNDIILKSHISYKKNLDSQIDNNNFENDYKLFLSSPEILNFSESKTSIKNTIVEENDSCKSKSKISDNFKNQNPYSILFFKSKSFDGKLNRSFSFSASSINYIFKSDKVKNSNIMNKFIKSV